MKNNPKSIEDFVKILVEADVDWVRKNVHPYVLRSSKDTDASYVRKMALWMKATNVWCDSLKGG